MQSKRQKAMFRSCFESPNDDDDDSRTNAATNQKKLASVSFSQETILREHVLLEIVGAMGLSSMKDFSNSYCTVDVNDKTVHKTSTVKVRLIGSTAVVDFDDFLVQW